MINSTTMTAGFTSLLARLVNRVITRRQFSDGLLGLGFGLAAAESVLDSPALAEVARRDAFEAYSLKTPYEQWMAREGLPVHTGYHIPDVRTLEVKPWARMGARGALIDLEGAEGTDGAYLLVLEPAASTKPRRFLFEETLFVLDGEGETTVWQEAGKKKAFAWKKGSLFSPPLNVWRQHVNRGRTPARLISVHDLPAILDIFHSADFVFNNDFVFRDRYNNQADYFAFNSTKLVGGGSLAMFNEGERAGVRMADTGLIPDVNRLDLYEAHSRGLKNRGIEMVFSDNTMQTHISEFETGSYKRAHRHGPGSHIVILGGVGYSLMWNDNPQYSKASKHMRVDWREGSLFVPPDRWFHQHFNAGQSAAKYMATSWIGGKYFAKALGGGGRTHRLNTVSVRKGGNMIDYPDEDPLVRSMFDEELRKHGLQSQMPARS